MFCVYCWRMIETMKLPSQWPSQLQETSKVSLEEEFLETTPRNTIYGQKDSKQVENEILISIYFFFYQWHLFFMLHICNHRMFGNVSRILLILATVKDIMHKHDWWILSACAIRQYIQTQNNVLLWKMLQTCHEGGS